MISRYSAVIVLWMIQLPFEATGVQAATTTLYRCTTESGVVEFRQTQCPRGKAKQIRIEDVQTGWTAPEKMRIESPASEVRKGKKRGESGGGKPSARDQAAEKCFTKRQQLERVNRKLRAGYKAGQGTALRQRRRDYEDYLRRFCR